jgi:hypothetical protein
MAMRLYYIESSTSSNMAFGSDMLMSHFCQCTSIIHGTLDCGKSNATIVAMSMTIKLDWPQSQSIVKFF